MEGNIAGLQNEMAKMNALISKNQQLQEMLVETNMDLENDFHAQLKVSARGALLLNLAAS